MSARPMQRRVTESSGELVPGDRPEIGKVGQVKRDRQRFTQNTYRLCSADCHQSDR